MRRLQWLIAKALVRPATWLLAAYDRLERTRVLAVRVPVGGAVLLTCKCKDCRARPGPWFVVAFKESELEYTLEGMWRYEGEKEPSMKKLWKSFYDTVAYEHVAPLEEQTGELYDGRRW